MKKTIRREITKKLAEISGEQLRKQSQNTAQALRTLECYKQSTRIAFYMHMDRCELQTTEMISNAFHDGKRVFLPHIVDYSIGEVHHWFPKQTKHLRMLEIPDLENVNKLIPRGRLNLKEPISGNDCFDEGGLDLIILPGVGFTSKKQRIGHGAGFYDSFINEHEYKLNHIPYLVGVGLENQLVNELPLESHDKMLDVVIVNGCIYE